jgi:peptide/nickel transport system substrate-binding protein
MIPDPRRAAGMACRLAAAVALVAAAGCARPSAIPTFVFGIASEPVQLDPAVAVDAASLLVSHQIHETLVRLRPGTTEVEPGLAERWETSPDGLTWTFHLRAGVRFHDGTPLDAEAVVWNLERWMRIAHPQHADQVRAGQTFEYWESLFGGFDDASLVRQAEVAGPLRVRLLLRRRHAPLLANLAVPGLGIASPAAVVRHGIEYGKHPAGTGPFRLAGWRPRQDLTLEANPEYWGGRPRMPRVVVRPVTNSAQRLAGVISGELHAIEGLDPDAVRSARQDERVVLVMRPALSTGFLVFNFHVKELRDQRVRRAFAHAIDKRALVEALYGEIGLVATQLQPPALWGRDPTLTDYRHDPDLARALLTAAGFPGGLDAVTWTDGRREPLTLWYMPVSRPYFPVPREIAQAIGADLARAGITARLETVDWAVYLDRIRQGRLPLFMLGWIGDNGDPDNALCYVFCVSGAPAQGFYANPALSGLLRRAQALGAEPGRARLYRQAERLLYEDVARLFLVYSQTPLVLSRRVRGYVPSPTGAESWAGVELR